MLAVLGEYPRACVLVVNREAAPVWEMYQDEMREVETVTDPLRKAGNTGGSRPEDRIQNRVDEQAKRHLRHAGPQPLGRADRDGPPVTQAGRAGVLPLHRGHDDPLPAQSDDQPPET